MNFSDYGIIVNHAGGKQQKVSCPECTPHRKKKSTKDLAVNLETGVWFCHHCGWKGSIKDKERIKKAMMGLPKKTYKKPIPLKTYDIGENEVEWFFKRGISRTTLNKCGVTSGKAWMPQTQKEENCVIFNYFINGELINKKYRDGRKNMKMEKDAKLVFYAPMLKSSHKFGENLYIVEGEPDALTMVELGFPDVISPPNGAPPENTDIKNIDFSFFESIQDIAPDFKRAFLVMDSDKVGARFRDEIARRIGIERCFFAEYPKGCKDINDVLCKFGEGEAKNIVKECKPYPIKGKYDVSDLADRIYNLWVNGFEPGKSTGWHSIDNLYTVRQRELTVVTGIPSHGKSSWLDHLICNLAKHHNWGFGIFSPENFPFERHIAKLCEIYIGKPFDKGFNGAMSENELSKACEWCNDHFHFLMPDEDDEQSLDNILKLAKASIFKDGIHGLIIDPWNEIEHEMGKDPETVYISKALSKIRKFNRVNNIHTWLVAHPTKLIKNRDGKYSMPSLYDISGSANFYNKTDNGVVVHRNFEEGFTEIGVSKVRFKEIGKPGKRKLVFNSANGRFSDK